MDGAGPLSSFLLAVIHSDLVEYIGEMREEMEALGDF